MAANALEASRKDAHIPIPSRHVRHRRLGARDAAEAIIGGGFAVNTLHNLVNIATRKLSGKEFQDRGIPGKRATSYSDTPACVQYGEVMVKLEGEKVGPPGWQLPPGTMAR